MSTVSVSDRGVVVRVELNPPIVVEEAWASGTRVQISALRTSFGRRPADDETFTVEGSGLQLNQDGRVGRRARSRVSVARGDIPEDVRAAVVKAAQDTFDKRGAP